MHFAAFSALIDGLLRLRPQYCSTLTYSNQFSTQYHHSIMPIYHLAIISVPNIYIKQCYYNMRRRRLGCQAKAGSPTDASRPRVDVLLSLAQVPYYSF